MSKFCRSVMQAARKFTDLLRSMLDHTRQLCRARCASVVAPGSLRSGWRGLPAVLMILPAALLAIPATAQTVVGAKFSIASGWAGTAAAFDGTNFLVALQSDISAAKVAAQLVSPGGAKIGSTIALSHDGQSCCAAGIAFDGTNYLVAWEEDQGIKNRSDPFMVYGRFINTSGAQVGQAFPMTTAGIYFDGVNMLAFGGGKYLLTYTRLINPNYGDGSNNRYVAGRIISPDGTMGNEFRISTGFGNGSSVAFDGTNFFVVWKEDLQDQEVRGRIVSPSGALLAQEISINASQAASDYPVVVSYDNTNYLVVWTDDAGFGGDVFAQRVSPGSALVGGPITIATDPGMQMAMGAAFDGTNHLVTWVDMKNDANGNGSCDAGEGSCADVYGQYVGKDGALAGSKFAINTDAGNQIGGVGCAGGQCLALISSGIVFGHGGLAQVGEVYGAFLTSQASTTTTTNTTTSSTTTTTITLNERVRAFHDFDMEGGWYGYAIQVTVPIPQGGVSPINGFTLSGLGIAAPVQAVNQGTQWFANFFFGNNPPAMPATYTANLTLADGTAQTRTYTVQKWSSAFPTSITPAANSIITGPMPAITWTNVAASGLLYRALVYSVPSSGPYVLMWVRGGYASAPSLYDGPTLPAGNYKIFVHSYETVGVVEYAAQVRVPIQCGGAGCTADSGGAGTLSFVPGWNLVGNSSSGTLDIATPFGDNARVTTVWKWIASSAKWAFYAPSLVGQALTDYASGKGYDVLTTITGGEGFWVNAKTAFSASLPSGTAIASASFKGMGPGWNLIAVGDSPTPSAFNKSIGQTTPAAGDIPLNLTTLWAWDATQSNWYFYAPSLDKSGGLASYITSKNYLDFGTRVLDPTTGFWVNKP